MAKEQLVSIQLTFIDADERKPNPFIVREEARRSVDALRVHGYTIHPVYTGSQGGDVFQLVTQISQTIVENRELLVSLISLSMPILTFLLSRHEKRLDKQEASSISHQRDRSTSIIFVINQASAQVEAADLGDSERLLQKLLEEQPALISTVTPESQPEIRIRVSPGPKRGRW
ncbi:MAG: hypothetical protein MI924_10355 [Chloroflexales bacterium]|nr:hypothetical protein [Chloroflexales bacterium]